MDTELLQALGAEVAEVIAEQAAAQAEQIAILRAEVQGLREAAGDAVIAFALDAEGALSLIQRSGPPRRVPLPDVEALVRAAVDAFGQTVRAEAQASVARAFEVYCNAPAWSPSAVYVEGEIVQTDVGRTYRVRKGVRAALGRVPGDDAEHWERLGTGGFRVLKSRPEALAPGDVFTEHDARFLHDGENTILFVPKAPKTSDVERAVKAPYTLGQANQAELREQAARLAAVLADVQRSTRAANDANEIGVQALAQVEVLQRDLVALRERLEQLASGAAP
jgi:hypothetical protein